MPRMRHEGSELMDCPECGAPEMIFYPGEEYEEGDEEGSEIYQEPDAYECVDCGHFEVV